MKREGTENSEQRTSDADPTPHVIDPSLRWRRMIGPAIILLGAGFAMLPEWLRGPSCGHDFDFHLVSWIDAQHSWRHGILYPHWTPTPNFEAGEPRFIFYPPLTWMLGALLGTILPWRIVPLVITFLLLAAPGLATRALARQVYDDGVSTLAGCAALFSGYALFTAYERSAFAEMTGGFWVPLMLMLLLRGTHPENAAGSTSDTSTNQITRLGGLEPGTKPRPVSPGLATDETSPHRSKNFIRLDRTTTLLALVVAGTWLSNAPLGVMLSYLLAAVSLLIAMLGRSWMPIVRAAMAAMLGLGLSAFFWIPAAWEQRWVAIRQAIDDPGLLIENSWLFARHHDPGLELHDVELLRVSVISITMFAVALAGFAINWRRRSLPRSRQWWIPLALIPIAVLLLQLPISDVVWNSLPKLRFLQFPWRWLVVVEAPMAIFFASALWTGRRLWRTLVAIGCCVAFVLATAFALVSMFQGCDQDDEVRGILRAYSSGTGVEGTDEYAPPGADNSLIPTGLPFACLVSDAATKLGTGDPDMTPDWSPDQGSCDAIYPSASGSPLHLHLYAQAPHAGYLVLRLRTYPAWKLTVNGTGITGMPARQDGLMAVPVPSGTIRLEAEWTTTPDVLAGRLVSAAALLLITLGWLVPLWPVRARLS
jgi:hypothetical protein